MFAKHLIEGGKIDVARARGRVQKPDAIASDGRDGGRGPRLRQKAAYSRYKYAAPHAPLPDGAKSRPALLFLILSDITLSSVTQRKDHVRS
jgi:hypothetical protein